MRLLSEEEMLGCSLVGKYPFEAIRDVIEETCEHQDKETLKGVHQDLMALLKDANDLRDLERKLVEYVESLKSER